DAESLERTGGRDDVFVRVCLPRHGDVPSEVDQGARRARAPETAGHAPLADLEGPREVRRRIEIELGPTVDDDLREAEIAAEVELPAAAGREDVDVLVDPYQDVDAVGADPLVADVVDRALR